MQSRRQPFEDTDTLKFTAIERIVTNVRIFMAKFWAKVVH